MKTITEPILALVLFVAGFLMALLGFYEKSTYFQSLWASGAVTSVGLGVALLVVNYYLDRKSKNRALSALFELVGPSLHDLTDTLVREAHDFFGEHDFDTLTDTYQKGGWKSTALNPEQRQKIYHLVADNRAIFLPLLTRLNESLMEFSSVVGWTFNPQVLYLTFSCRSAVNKVQSSSFDGSDEAIKTVCEGFLDAALHSAKIYDSLNPFNTR